MTLDLLANTAFQDTPLPKLQAPNEFRAAVTERLQAAAEQNPEPYADALNKTLDHPETRQRIEDEVKKGIESVRQVNAAFTKMLELLARVDAQNFRGSDGQPIQKFAPEFLGYKRTFQECLLKTEGLATAGCGVIDLFSEGVIPILEDKTLSLEEKIQGLDAISENITSMATNVCSVDELIQTYTTLKDRLVAFRSTVIDAMGKTGQKLDTDYRRVEMDLAMIQQEVDKFNAERLRFPDRTTSGSWAIREIIVPITSSVMGASVLGDRRIAEAFHQRALDLDRELNKRRADLEALSKVGNEYQAVRPYLDSVASDLGAISQLLVAPPSLFKAIRGDIEHAKHSLQGARGQAPNLFTKSEIKLALQSYASLQVTLYAFATGFSSTRT